MAWIPVTNRLPPFGKNVLACSSLAVTYQVAYVSPQDGKWHLAFGDTPIQHITHWMPLPELPVGKLLDLRRVISCRGRFSNTGRMFRSKASW
jgi:hypothetical protein